jgi:hypothetical protein
MRLLPLLALATGCYAQIGIDGGSGTAFDPDDDGDGLTNGEEAELGTDPAVADTDADTYNDGDEVAANADPLDADHHPYLGGWPIGACRTDVEGNGTAEGDISYDFALKDQFDEFVRLYDFCDRTVLLVFAGFD